MADEMQGVENTAIAPEQHNVDSADGNESHVTSGGASDHPQRETHAVVPPFLLHYADVWHPVFSSITEDKLSKARSSGFIPSDAKFGSVLLEGRGAEFLSQPLNRILEEIEGVFSIENDVSLEIPALAPLVFNINNSFCEDLTISDVHFAHTGAAGVDCPILARLLIEPHHFASVWNAFVQGAEQAESEEEIAPESSHQDSMDVDQNGQDISHVAENAEIAAAQDALPVTSDVAAPAEHEAEVAASAADVVDAETAIANADADADTVEVGTDAAEVGTDAAEAEPDADADADGAVDQDGEPENAEDHQDQEQLDDFESADAPAQNDAAGADSAQEPAVDAETATELDAESGAQEQLAEETAAEQAAEELVELEHEEPMELPEIEAETQEPAGDAEADDELLDDLDSGMVDVPDDLGDLEGELEPTADDSQNLKKRARDDSQTIQADADAPVEDSELQESEPKRLKTDSEHVAPIEHAVAAN
eukprot:TRINITY_DN1436_c0_g1_i1.p1 TRINITY_DN1436_c0_g1~~TRINITY_DN1436_c0_g1_i1.p1  ORF type:complete len:481 (+),score=130.20 TRINITY_DN1436_c0_g1_i1:201-1643(+)